jgi:type II secretory pathway pseudopilin PulG
LVEMMIVLAMLGILSAFGVWQMLPALERTKLRRGTTILAADLQYAQMVSARQRTPVVFVVDEALQSYLIRDRAGTTIYRQRFLGADTDYGLESLVAEPQDAVEVFPTGVALANMTFTLGIKDEERQVKLTRAGQIRVLHP